MSKSKEPSPKIVRILRKYKIAAFFIILFSAYAGYTLGLQASENSVASAIAGFAVFWISNKVLSWVTLAFLQLQEYGTDSEQFAKDAEEASALLMNKRPTARAPEEKKPEEKKPTNQQVKFNIINRPETPLGSYMDNPFFEWVEVESLDGQAVRFNFVGTTEIKSWDSLQVPPHHIILAPGIIYQDTRHINNAQ